MDIECPEGNEKLMGVAEDALGGVTRGMKRGKN
jgi:hypothetical protein